MPEFLNDCGMEHLLKPAKDCGKQPFAKPLGLGDCLLQCSSAPVNSSLLTRASSREGKK